MRTEEFSISVRTVEESRFGASAYVQARPVNPVRVDRKISFEIQCRHGCSACVLALTVRPTVPSNSANTHTHTQTHSRSHVDAHKMQSQRFCSAELRILHD